MSEQPKLIFLRTMLRNIFVLAAEKQHWTNLVQTTSADLYFCGGQPDYHHDSLGSNNIRHAFSDVEPNGAIKYLFYNSAAIRFFNFHFKPHPKNQCEYNWWPLGHEGVVLALLLCSEMIMDQDQPVVGMYDCELRWAEREDLLFPVSQP